MQCATSRQLISARLDGECSDQEAAALDAHLALCAACRSFAREADRLHRAVRLGAAPQIPDLTAAILSRQATRPTHPGHRGSRARRRSRATAPSSRDRSRVGVALRAGMVAVALVQLIGGLHELVVGGHGHSLGVHAARHLGAWDIAFAVGLLVVAVQPWRVSGFLPMATALVVLMGAAAGVDTINRQTPGMANAMHLLELAGLLLAWALSRWGCAGGPRERRAAAARPATGAASPAPHRWLPGGTAFPPSPAGRDRQRPAA